MSVIQRSKHWLLFNMISIIAAIGRNRVIGIDGNLPWHLPRDFAWFKSCTQGKAIIMGRKTFESLGRPLPKRLNIVISRNPPSHNEHDNVLWATSLPQAIDMAQAQADTWGDEIMIIGGGEIYTQALSIADRLYLTEVNYAPENGDAFFPEFDATQWQRQIIESYPQEHIPETEKEAEIIRPSFDIVQYDRK